MPVSSPVSCLVPAFHRRSSPPPVTSLFAPDGFPACTQAHLPSLHCVFPVSCDPPSTVPAVKLVAALASTSSSSPTHRHGRPRRHLPHLLALAPSTLEPAREPVGPQQEVEQLVERARKQHVPPQRAARRNEEDGQHGQQRRRPVRRLPREQHQRGVPLEQLTRRGRLPERGHQPRGCVWRLVSRSRSRETGRRGEWRSDRALTLVPRSRVLATRRPSHILTHLTLSRALSDGS